MSDKSAIEWTDATWNPTTGCDRVSPGCANCYALDLAARLKRMGAPAYQVDGDPRTSGPGFGLQLHPERLEIPLRWTRPRRIFVNSMSDLFHEAVPGHFVDRVFAVMALAPQHTFQVLTKRPERMREYLLTSWGDGHNEPRSDREEAIWSVMPEFLADSLMAIDLERPAWPSPNVWLGTSVENARWRTRIDELRQTPAAVRFLSCEPLLGPLVCPVCKGAGWDVEVRTRTSWECCGDVLPTGECCAARYGEDRLVPVEQQEPVQIECPGPDGRSCLGDLDLDGIGWVIVGGESGPDHRPVDGDWIRDIRDACIRQDVPLFFKQWGGRTPKSGGRELDGRTWDEMPDRTAVPA